LLGDSTQSAVLSSEVSKRAVENNALWQKDIYHYREDLIEAIKEGKDPQEIHDYYKSLSERQREELLADCGADCRLPMKNLLEGATDLADDLTGVINTWLSNLPESEQTKFYQLIESENQKTINALSEKQGLSEDLVEKG
ncbi:VENN motif pre-toxin domain-containing protein, partial [Pasteurellaceae bacterium LIM206]|nr:VENN motif pre-toxin domain-containing protein [Pasteurellaceae bacterium LIM206]